MYIFTIKSNNETKHSKRSYDRYETKGYQKGILCVSRFPRSNSTVSIGGSEHRLTTATDFPRPDGSATSGALLRAECTGRGLAKWSERERLSRAVCVRAYAYALPSRERTHGEKEKEKEGGERECRWVGCEPLPPGTCAVFE